MEDSAALRAELFWAVGMQDSGDVVMFSPKPLPEGPQRGSARGGRVDSRWGRRAAVQQRVRGGRL